MYRILWGALHIVFDVYMRMEIWLRTRFVRCTKNSLQKKPQRLALIIGKTPPSPASLLSILAECAALRIPTVILYTECEHHDIFSEIPAEILQQVNVQVYHRKDVDAAFGELVKGGPVQSDVSPDLMLHFDGYRLSPYFPWSISTSTLLFYPSVHYLNLRILYYSLSCFQHVVQRHGK